MINRISPLSNSPNTSKRLLLESVEREERLVLAGGTLSAAATHVKSNADSTSNQDSFSEAIELLQDAELDIVAEERAEAISAVDVVSDINYVSAGDIEGLFYHSQLDVSLVGLDLIESTVLLLKNGWAYRGLRSSPLDLVAPRPEAKAEGHWSHWRNSVGRGYELLDAITQGWEPIPGIKIDTSPREPHEVAGQFTRARTQNWGGTIFTSEQTLTLTEDGKFGTSTSTLASGGGIGSLVPNASVASYHNTDMSGSTTVVTANSHFAGGVTSTALSDDRLVELLEDRVGDFELLGDGLSIEFKYANGDVKRELFFHYDDHVYVDDRSYTLESKSTDGFMLALQAIMMYQSEGVSSNWLAEIGKALQKHGQARHEPSTKATPSG